MTCRAAGCESAARGATALCQKHNMRQRRHGSVDHVTPPAPHPLETVRRAVAEVTESDCWLTRPSSRSSRGYGYVSAQGKRRIAHRYVYEVLVGPIPVGLQLDHLCRTPACINPRHLEPVTGAENVRRHWAAVRSDLRRQTA